MNPVFDVRSRAAPSLGGIPSVSRLLSAAASVNATVVKASMGRVYKITGRNAATTTTLYIKLYNKATAPAATDTPVATIAVYSGDFNIDLGPIGLSFSAGISYRITGAAADDDTTALTAGDIVCMNVFYA